MKSLLTTLCVVLTGVIWWAAVAVTQQLNEIRHIEDQKAALTLSDRTLTSPAVWSDLFATLGNQEIERLFAQPGARDLLIEATEKLLYTAIEEYRKSIREKQAAATDINDSLQALSQAFLLDLLIDFEALETSVPGIAAAFVKDLENGELAGNLEVTLNQYFTSLSGDLNTVAQRQKNALQGSLQCHSTSQCLTTLNAAQREHGERFKWWMLWLLSALLILLALNQFGHLFSGAEKSAHIITLCMLNSAILALLVPGIGVPMMKLRAFVEPFTVNVGGASIYFDQQLLMYQNKSIGDLVNLLIETGQLSLFFLAAGMTLFCVLLPAGKCLAAITLLLSNNSSQGRPLLRWLAIDSGKWSMADVFVVALIMAYIGMDQLISSHASAMNTLFAESQFIQIASASELGVGFFFFLAFVLLSFWTARKCQRALEAVTLRATISRTTPP